jgi:hypothetical protein
MMTSLNNVNNASFERLLKTLRTDKASNKIIESLADDDKVSFNVVEDNVKDDQMYTTEYNTTKQTMKVTLNIDDINREAKKVGIPPEVFLAQQAGSVLAGVYLQEQALADGKDPSEYGKNAEFQVAKNLVADGMVRRTLGKSDPKTIAYLDKNRANMAEVVKAQYGSDFIETSESDALDRFKALGFVGMDGWADKIVQTFGTKPSLELKSLEETDKTDKTAKAEKDDEVEETETTDDTDETAETEKAEKAEKEAKAEKADKDWIPGIPNWLLAAGGGGLLGYFLGGSGKTDAKEVDQVAVAAQRELDANRLQYQQREAILKQQLAQQQAMLQAVATRAASNTATPIVTYPTTTPIVTSTYPITTTTTAVNPVSSTPVTYAVLPVNPTASKNDWT